MARTQAGPKIRRRERSAWEPGSAQASSARRMRRCWSARAASSTTLNFPECCTRRLRAARTPTPASAPSTPRRHAPCRACIWCWPSPTCRRRCARTRCRCSYPTRRSHNCTCPIRSRARRPSTSANRSRSWWRRAATSPRTPRRRSRSTTRCCPRSLTVPRQSSRTARSRTSAPRRTSRPASPSVTAIATPRSPPPHTSCATGSRFIAAGRSSSNAAA